jgi:hypothetical protein
MANSSSLLKQIALSRLTALGCEMLPPAVSKLVVSSFVERAEQRLTRLARREITVPKIAKLFTHPKGKRQFPTLAKLGHRTK